MSVWTSDRATAYALAALRMMTLQRGLQKFIGFPAPGRGAVSLG